MSPAAALLAPEIDADRLRADLEAMAAITEPDRPWTRRSFTPRFLEGRAWLARAFAAEGLAVHVDAAGNLIGRRAGSDPSLGVLMTGSHSDTVPDGGRFDGIGGVLASLACLRAMRAAGYQPRHAIELVDFLAEEPSDWGLSCIGSRGMAGALGPDALALTGPGGETLAAAIDRVGGNVAALGTARRTDVAGFLELHIEQGPVLEARGRDVGIVTAIAGICRMRIVFEGEAGHAGTLPMAGRRDAGLALARLQLALREAALAEAGAGHGHFVATIGLARLLPGGANVVPGGAEAIVDIRAEDAAALTRFEARLAALGRAAAAAEGCTVSLTPLSRTQPVPCDAGLRGHLAQAASRRQLGQCELASGAGHDAAFLARIAPAAMLFVPCVAGRSHCPEEWTDPAALARGASCLLDALLSRDAA